MSDPAYELRVSVFIKEKEVIDKLIKIVTPKQMVDTLDALRRDSALDVVEIHAKKLTPRSKKL